MRMRGLVLGLMAGCAVAAPLAVSAQDCGGDPACAERKAQAIDRENDRKCKTALQNKLLAIKLQQDAELRAIALVDAQNKSAVTRGLMSDQEATEREIANVIKERDVKLKAINDEITARLKCEKKPTRRGE